ncbi:acetyltransferase [Clostridium gasigenes]|uniref:acetyltransferase n=1 Tax=Clostridium gasigenes TaxID=94869 RepID=UPI0016249096|nr:acetyltransferase [Clostridium gasigenes]MBB6624657.1 acetyltransferase [Clostridium gasigenes]MBU3137165.1 acetyltransferase [Clostridium gasigenes]
MKNLIIIGAGGVGRETAWIVEQINQKELLFNILGFVDDNEELWGNEINGYNIIGGLQYLDGITCTENIELIISIANYKVKKNIVAKLNNKFKFATLIHPEVYISSTIIIGSGNIIYPGVIMTTNITIGNHIIVSPKCGIGHDSIIKDYVSLLWNVNVSGFNIIEEGAFIGSAATIIQNKRIGKKTIIGAAAVVINDIEAEVTAVGIPARVIKGMVI